jgi:hypothetical protein
VRGYLILCFQIPAPSKINKKGKAYDRNRNVMAITFKLQTHYFQMNECVRRLCTIMQRIKFFYFYLLGLFSAVSIDLTILKIKHRIKYCRYHKIRQYFIDALAGDSRTFAKNDFQRCQCRNYFCGFGDFSHCAVQIPKCSFK